MVLVPKELNIEVDGSQACQGNQLKEDYCTAVQVIQHPCTQVDCIHNKISQIQLTCQKYGLSTLAVY
jgi:hypothetical protein